jgi:hypothetical protein
MTSRTAMAAREIRSPGSWDWNQIEDWWHKIDLLESSLNKHPGISALRFVEAVRPRGHDEIVPVQPLYLVRPP